MRFLRRVLVLRRLLFRLLRPRPRVLGFLLRCRREQMQGFAFCRRLLVRLLRQRPRVMGLLLRCRREKMQSFDFCNKGIGLRLGCSGLRLGLFGNGCRTELPS